MANIRKITIEEAGVEIEVSFAAGRDGRWVVAETRSLDSGYVTVSHSDEFALIRRDASGGYTIQALWRQPEAVPREGSLRNSLVRLSAIDPSQRLADQIKKTAIQPVVSTITAAKVPLSQQQFSPQPPPRLYFETPMDEIRGLRADFERGSSRAMVTLTTDTSHHFTVTVLKNKEGKLSIAKEASLNWGDFDFECEVSPLSGGRTYEVTAEGIKYYLYVTEDGGPILTQVGPGELGLIPTKKELKIAYQLSQTTGKDRGPLKLALREEINKRPLPPDLEMAGAIPRGCLREKPIVIKLVGNGGYFAEVAMSAQDVDHLRPLGSGQIVTELLGEREGVFTIYGPQGYRKSLEAIKVTWGAVAHIEGERAIWVGFDLSSLREGRPRVVATRNMRVIQHNLVGGQRRDTTFADEGRRFLQRFWGDDTGSTPIDHDAHITQARAHGFTPSSPKAFCTYANLGVATLAGMGVEWFFSGDEENGEHHTRAEVGFWRHVATALATGYTSTLFSNGRISIDQALKSYGKGLLTGLPIDFGFNAAGFGSSPFAFAASFLANHFGDNVVDALIARNPFAMRLAAMGGLALFIGSTAYSYYNETRQNKPNQLA